MEPLRCSYCNTVLTGQSHCEHNGLPFCEWICATLMFPEMLHPHVEEKPSQSTKKKKARKSRLETREDKDAVKYIRRPRRQINWAELIFLSSIDPLEKPRPIKRPSETTSEPPPLPLKQYFEAIKKGTWTESC